jgi:probable rRNA maturation factor
VNILLLGKAPRKEADRALLKKAVRLALGRHAARPGELCVVFLSDAEIRKLNRRFLAKDRATDVLAFRYEDVGFPRARRSEAPFGDVYIGVEKATRQAKELGHGLLDELATLATHGTLHLLGFDDQSAAERKTMFERQEKLVRKLLKSGSK